MKYFLIILVFVILQTNIYADKNNFKLNTDIKTIFQIHNIDISKKSYKGWIRVLSNKEKIKLYHLDFLKDNEIIKYKKELLELSQNEIKGVLR